VGEHEHALLPPFLHGNGHFIISNLHMFIVIATRYLCYFLKLFLFKNLPVESLSLEVSLSRLLPFRYVMDYASPYLIYFTYLLSYV